MSTTIAPNATRAVSASDGAPRRALASDKMPLSLGRSRYSPIGIDWGKTSLCVAQWTRGRSAPVAHAVATIRPAVLGVPRGFSLPQLNSGLPPQVSSAVRNALTDAGMRGKRWAVGVTAPEIEFHLLDLPLPKNETVARGQNAELDQAAHFEIQRLMHLTDEQVETDWWPLPPERRSTSSAVGAVVASSCVHGICRWVTECGFDCVRMDATACALARFGFLLARPSSDETWGLLDLGARGARLIICIDAVPVMVRAFEHGQDRWTQRIAEGMQLAPDSAEQLKCEFGIDYQTPAGRGLRAEPTPFDGRRASDQSSVAQASARRPMAQVSAMIYSALRSELEQIIKELERSFQYVLQSFPTRRASSLLLTGGGAAMNNLDVYLTERLGIQVRDIESLRTMSAVDLSRVPRGCLRTHAAALGLALVPV